MQVMTAILLTMKLCLIIRGVLGACLVVLRWLVLSCGFLEIRRERQINRQKNVSGFNHALHLR